jgi:hypothetical protein
MTDQCEKGIQILNMLGDIDCGYCIKESPPRFIQCFLLAQNLNPPASCGCRSFLRWFNSVFLDRLRQGRKESPGTAANVQHSRETRDGYRLPHKTIPPAVFIVIRVVVQL